MQKQQGQSELLVLLGVIVLFAIFTSGGLLPKKNPNLQSQSSAPGGQCCNNANCSLVDGTEITFRGEQYKLLKSNMALGDQSHLVPAPPPDDLTPSGERIFLNYTFENGTSALYSSFCGPPGNDTFFKSGAQCTLSNIFSSDCCFSIPDNTIIYVCKSQCQGSVGFGKFDAYYKVGPPVDDNIKNCDPNNSIFGSIPAGQPGGDLVICPTPNPQQALQLDACKIIKVPETAIPWFSPFCKPAIYLYPEEKTNVGVHIAPQGKLTIAIPHYPSIEGWQVTANPDGKIYYENSSYDYLYYEAEIPDALIEKPKEGFVVEYNKLTGLFADLLPKLGLNEKESKQFSDYWLKALPKSPYYFVGIASVGNLDTIAPLTIQPQPDTIIRVTLYFQTLDKQVSVPSPTIAPVRRDGFTVVEWGGIVKTDPNHPFSCLM